ncbi:hypothetical protein TNCV_4913541 [Trichonephila clavipes]|nr:hypothetical protein TNCV_4913541 [Trichonephila clavipes]
MSGTLPLACLDCLCTVSSLPWPERSLEFSPIEHVWNMVQRQIRAPQNIADQEKQLAKYEVKELFHTLSRSPPADSQLD